MKLLRQIHLYLGCVFAPLLCFFAVSGVWQLYGLNETNNHKPRLLAILSILHTGARLKVLSGPDHLSSPAMRVFVIMMAVSLLITMALGIFMTFRFGRGRVATICLLAGVGVPAAFIALALKHQ